MNVNMYVYVYMQTDICNMYMHVFVCLYVFIGSRLLRNVNAKNLLMFVVNAIFQPNQTA